MGKITINEIHKSLYNYAQAVSDENLMTESKTIVNAINEIYGKQLIANAIGEPLNDTDTFTKMNDDINSLLSTFKTNMMNAGTVVESNDKFKQLIDKIKGLTEGEGNKSIQFATGIYTVDPIKNVVRLTYDVNVDFGFTPNYIFAEFCYDSYQYNDNGAVNIISNIKEYDIVTNSTINGTVTMSNLSSTGFTITSSSSYAALKGGTFNYYAIGVGEEDTTLRDSLADILQDEGVEVTPEDTMADLIVKVDEEFDRKNANSGLDIISATELPNEVVNNQVCLITESFGKVYITNELSTSVLNEGDVYIKTTTAGYYATTHIITPMNDISLNLSRIVQIKNGTEEKIDGYVGIDGQWVPTDSLEFYLFKKGTGLHPSVGGFDIIEHDGEYSVNNNYISLTGYADFGDITIQSKNKIDLTEYSKLEVKSSSSGYGGFTLSVGSVGDNVLYLSDNASEPAVLDISAINGLQYIKITKGSNYQNQSGTIYYIKLIKEFK